MSTRVRPLWVWNMTPLQRIRDIYIRTLNLASDDQLIPDAITSAYLANVCSQVAEPVWLQVIGPPSSHKTESLRPILSYRDTIPLSSITENALISGHRDQTGSDPSLINQLDRRNLVIKDMTTLHSMNRNSRDKVYSDLRDAFDGSCSKASGTSGLTTYKAKFGVLCAVTEVVDAFSHESQQLGERFLSFRTFRYLPTHRESCDYLRHVLAASETKALWRNEMTTIVHTAFDEIKTHALQRPPVPIPDEYRDEVIIIAHLLAQFRTSPVNDTPVTGEMASRVVQQLINLGSMHAMSDYRETWNESDLTLIKRIVIDTLPVQRRRLISTLYHSANNAPPPMAIQQIARMSRMSEEEVTTLLSQYVHNNLAAPSVSEDGTYKYALTTEVRHLMNHVKLFCPGPHLPGLWQRTITQ